MEPDQHGCRGDDRGQRVQATKAQRRADARNQITLRGLSSYFFPTQIIMICGCKCKHYELLIYRFRQCVTNSKEKLQ
jgi:hypothetical protein